MATALPNTGKLQLPIQWSGSTTKTTMETGSFQLSTTIGLNPFVEMATFTWIFTDWTVAQAHLQVFKDDMMNANYSYTCPIQGAMTMRPTGSWSILEVGDRSHTEVSIEFRRLK